MSSGQPAPQEPRTTDNGQRTTDEVQDLVFFGETRPVLLRLRVLVDGKSVTAAWDEYVGRLFDYLDRDGDGVLNKEEAARVPHAQSIAQVLRGSIFVGVNLATVPALDQSPADEEVTREELAAYYRRGGAGPIQVAAAPGRAAQTDGLTEALFKYLDTAGDGKLTKEKLAAATKLLAKLDTNDDELIATTELVPTANAPFGTQVLIDRPVSVLPLANTGFFAVGGDDSPRSLTSRLQLAQELLKRYDADKDEKLSRAESGLERPAFRKLDVNQDGALDNAELLKFLQLPADLDLVVRAGKLADRKAVDVVSSETRAASLASAVRPADNGALAVQLPDARLTVRAAPAAPNQDQRRQNSREQFRTVLRMADTNQDGALDRQEIQAPRVQYLRGLFDLADRDADGKLTEKEALAYYELQWQATQGCAVISITDHGRALFELLDENRDGRLGIRELRSAWDRLAPLDRDGDGGVKRAEIIRQLDLGVGQSLATPPQTRVLVGQLLPVQAPALPPSAKGPLWFRKMDRNGDGDVSAREFLGSRDIYRRIDVDGDGLIGVEEAEVADVWLKNKIGPLPDPGPKDESRKHERRKHEIPDK